MDTRPHGNPLYLLERSDVGVVQLDRALTVVAMNATARRVLPIDEHRPFDQSVLAFHPERSVPKVRFMLDQAECPVANPPPMTMIINIPERVLLIKVTKLFTGGGEPAGYTLIFYDITEVVSPDEPAASATSAAAAPASRAAATPAPSPAATPAKRQLRKIPTVSQHRTVLVDVDAVVHIRAEGHYTWITTAQGASFCNLTIGDLAERLDSGNFMRIHRSYLANLEFAEQIVRDDGRLSLKLRGAEAALPVSRASVAELMTRLGLSELPAAG